MIRYDIEVPYLNYDYVEVPSTTGEYVRWADVAKLIQYLKEEHHIATQATNGAYADYAEGCADTYKEILEMLEREECSIF